MTHELRNPLMIIGGLVRRMMTRVDLPHGCRKKLKHVSHHVQHIEHLISDICDVVRPLKPNYSLVDMSELFTNWCKRVKTEAELAGIEMKTVIDEDLPPMYIDKSLIRQALWHILENCFDAMAGTGGKLTIKVLLCWDNIHIQFIDSGRGFKNISHKEALQPFISSKPGQMGLGLSLCRQIILEHDGSMEIIDRKQSGVTVIIKLPVKLTQPSWFAEKKS
jgi:signal transduction histidine kinase